MKLIINREDLNNQNFNYKKLNDCVIETKGFVEFLYKIFNEKEEYLT